MSRENVEIVRTAYEAWNARDMDALGEFLDPDVVMRLPKDWPEPGPFVGRDEVLNQLRAVRKTYDSDGLEPISDFIDAADRVVVRFINHGTVRGLELSQEITGVYTVRDGKVFTWEHFYDHAEALKTLGLSE